MATENWTSEKEPDVSVDVEPVEPVELLPSLSFEDDTDDARNQIRSEQSMSTLSGSEKQLHYRKKSEASLDEEQCTKLPDPPELTWSIDDDSPWPQVRAAVPNTDDPTLPTNTFRMWSLGIIGCVILSIFNQFFSMRYPTAGVPTIFVTLITLPLGRFMAQVLPTKVFRILGQEFTLNPGPFNIKEHALITIMASFGGPPYAMDIIATQRVFYNQNWGTLYEIILVLSTQFLGYGFAGLCRRFLVWPSSMLWPSTMAMVPFFTTLNDTATHTENGRISRAKFFYIAMTCSAIYYWFPGYLFQALSYFNWVCWIAPDNFVINSLFGYTSGLGMSLLTFDWNMIDYVAAPLYTPWWAQVNTFVAFVIIYWLITPICYYTNVFYSSYLPMSSLDAFDNTGAVYIPEAITLNGTFNATMYEEYSPLYLSITFALDYGIDFALITALIVHILLWHRNDIARQFRTSLKEEGDIHSRLMAAYREVPEWWYLLVGVGSFGLALIATLVWPTDLPVWALILAIIISLVYLIPTGVVLAITNIDLGTNVVSEFISGYLLPGKPVANMIFKTFGLMTTQEALGFVSDLKFGHYMKIPPRMMFSTQMVATLISAILVVLTQDWMFSNVVDLCSPDQPDNFICPGTEIFGAASLIFGTIGPQRFFANGLYTPLLWCFLIGAVLPVIFYLLAKRYPNSNFKLVNIPVALGGLLMIPPASGFNYFSAFIVGAIFMYYLPRYHFRWWSQYNYILGVALDSGVAISLLLIYLFLYLPNGGTELNWWGNTVSFENLDGMYASWNTVAPGQTFGLTSW